MGKIPKKYGKAVTNVIFAVLIVVFCIWLLPKVFWLFMPFVIGWILALLANPLVRFFETKLKIKRKASTALVVVSVIGGISLGIYWIVAKLIEEAYGLFASLPAIWNSLQEDFASIGRNWAIIINRFPESVIRQMEEFGNNFGHNVSEAIGRLGAPTVGAVGSFAKNIPSILIGVIMCLLSAYFFVAEKEELTQFFSNKLSKRWKEKCALMKTTILGAIGGYFKAQFKIEIWIYMITVFGFMFLEIPYSFLIAVGVALLDLLPFFGTGFVLIPWSLLKFLSGDYGFGIGLLVIWGVGQLTRQVIQPKIVGDSIGVAPLPSLFLLYAGYRFSGVMGMIVAVPLGILVMKMNEAGFFDNTKNSLLLLWSGFNRFRTLTKEDLETIRTTEEEKE